MPEKAHGHHPTIKKLREERDRNDDAHPSVPSEPQRTLLLLGPTRAGKSTIVNILRDSLYETPKPHLYSATRAPSTTEIGGFRIIDMPGFFDQQSHDSQFALSNKNILKMLTDTIKENGPIDIVAFVFHLSNGIKTEDIETMVLVKQKLPSAGQQMMLIVTHAEELDEETRNGMIDDFFKHKKVIDANLRAYFNDEILFLGCLRYESLKQNNEDALRIEHKNVSAMRKTFIQKCINYVPNTRNHSDTSPASRCQKWRYAGTVSMIIVVLALTLAAIPVRNYVGYGDLPTEPTSDRSEREDYSLGDRHVSVNATMNSSHRTSPNSLSAFVRESSQCFEEDLSKINQQCDPTEEDFPSTNASAVALNFQTLSKSQDKQGSWKGDVQARFHPPCYSQCYSSTKTGSIAQTGSTSSNQAHYRETTEEVKAESEQASVAGDVSTDQQKNDSIASVVGNVDAQHSSVVDPSKQTTDASRTRLGEEMNSTITTGKPEVQQPTTKEQNNDTTEIDRNNITYLLSGTEPSSNSIAETQLMNKQVHATNDVPNQHLSSDNSNSTSFQDKQAEINK